MEQESQAEALVSRFSSSSEADSVEDSFSNGAQLFKWRTEEQNPRSSALISGEGLVSAFGNGFSCLVNRSL